MKKALLFVIALCCMMTVTAQLPKNKAVSGKWFKNGLQQVEQINRHTATYTEKLDSVLISYGSKQIYTYDDNYFVTKVYTVFSYGSVYYTASTEYTYDHNGNVSCMIETDNDESTKTVYSYSDDGEYIINAIHYILEGGSWNESEKIDFFSDHDDTYMVRIKYYFDDGEWEEDEKVEMFLTEDGTLIYETLSVFFDDEWFEVERTEYYYDNNNNCISVLSYIASGEDQMVEDEKDSYSYDSEGNCIEAKVYKYDSDESIWELDETSKFYYDLTTLNNTIAGFDLFFADETFSMNNKLLYTEGTVSGGTPYTFRFYYSQCTGVDEVFDNQVFLCPNPAIETLFIVAKDVQKVDIFSLDGKHVTTRENGFESINVSALPTGCYLLKALLQDGSTVTQKFVKQ